MSAIVYIDSSTIRDGKLGELRGAMTDLVAFVEANEPQLISYGFFLDSDEKRMTVVAIHPDVASLEFHMEIGGERFKRFADLIDLDSIDVYGSVSDSALARLRGKAEMLGRGVVTVHATHAAFSRP